MGGLNMWKTSWKSGTEELSAAQGQRRPARTPAAHTDGFRAHSQEETAVDPKLKTEEES